MTFIRSLVYPTTYIMSDYYVHHLLFDLTKRIGPFNCDQILFMLKTTSGLIAGGAVVASIVGGDVNDYDMFFHIDDFTMVYKTFICMGAKSRNRLYDNGFLCRNGILIHTTFTLRNTTFDVMGCIIEPISVCSRVDLTCCQVWFDGMTITGTHLTETENMVAFINPEYSRKPNTSRIVKYLKKGFSISIMRYDNDFFHEALYHEDDVKQANRDVKQAIDRYAKKGVNRELPLLEVPKFYRDNPIDSWTVTLMTVLMETGVIRDPAVLKYMNSIVISQFPLFRLDKHGEIICK